MSIVYTKKLKEFAKWNEKIDNAKISHSDFLTLQRERELVAEYYNCGYYGKMQRDILFKIANQMVDDSREVLRLNEAVKAISLEIRKQRNAKKGEL